MKKTFVYKYPLITIEISEENDCITELYVVEEEKIIKKQLDETELLKKANIQLIEYFAGERQRFELPLAPKGTAFQQKVWSQLLEIPYGKTKNYKDIAKEVGSPKGFRAVGNANGKNPISIMIPCHRVIAADGTLGGYSGGLDVKRKLLKLEESFLARKLIN